MVALQMSPRKRTWMGRPSKTLGVHILCFLAGWVFSLFARSPDTALLPYDTRRIADAVSRTITGNEACEDKGRAYVETKNKKCVASPPPPFILSGFHLIGPLDPEAITDKLVGVLAWDTVRRLFVIDVGLFNGSLILNMGKKFNISAHFVGFEAHPQLATTIKQKAGHMKNVEIVASGLSDTDGMMQLASLGVTDAGSSFSYSRGGKTVQATVTSLDKWLQTNHPEAVVDILKIDVQGWEQHVLKGALNLLTSERAPRYIIFEFGPYLVLPEDGSGEWCDCEFSLQLLLCLGYVCGDLAWMKTQSTSPWASNGNGKFQANLDQPSKMGPFTKSLLGFTDLFCERVVPSYDS